MPGRPGLFASRVLWGSALEGSARDLLAAIETEPDSDEDRSAKGEAVAFLCELLADGPVPSKQVRADADGAGHAWRTVERAAKILHIRPRRAKIGERGWQWALPTNSANTPPQKNMADMADLADLDAETVATPPTPPTPPTICVADLNAAIGGLADSPVRYRRVNKPPSIFDGRGVKAAKVGTPGSVSAEAYRRASRGE